MDLLIRGRPFIIAAFFISLVCFGLGLYLDHQIIFASSALAAHASLFLFTATESFGRVAQTRSTPARVMARIFLSMYVLAGVGFLSTWAAGENLV
jgi:hypothetical protein